MKRTRTSHQRFNPIWALTAAAAAFLLAAGACSGEGSDTADSPATTGATAVPVSADFTPVTIDHQFGSTEIAEAPQRILSLDPQWTDVLLALDVTPAGYVTHTLQESETFPWQGDLLADAEPVLYTDSVPYEDVAALDPDLIVVTYAATDQATYDTLSAIAPTVASPTDAEVQSWQTLTATTGEMLGRPDDAQHLIDDVDAQVKAAADELSGLEGKSIAFANYVSGGDIVVLADPADGANVLFSQLGLSLAPGIAAEGAGATGRVDVSPEQIGLLDGDVLVVLTNGTDVNDIAGWTSLPAVQTGAVVILDQNSATALNTPTPLSIGYGLDVLRPALEIAADNS